MSLFEESKAELLRQDEMVELINSEKNPITHQLMAEASNALFSVLMRRESQPIADFDLLYFMEVIKEFCSHHKVLGLILEGKGDEIPGFPTE